MHPKSTQGSLVLWKRPLVTFQYAFQESIIVSSSALKVVRRHKLAVISSNLILLLWGILLIFDGPHKNYVTPIQTQIMRCLYWLGLGVLSSVGLGTGLPTFVLYLGPYIAAVTIAAYECNSLDFPEPPFPDDIICPENVIAGSISIFQIMSKVRLHAMMWGAGTALGELPPYFMARASRLSGFDENDEDDIREIEDLKLKWENNESLTFMERLKLNVERIVETLGFFGILVCASIPNPLFDLAGITCGHFLVPFWTFFGATLLGKAVIKMHLQQVFVIVAFNENLITKAVNFIAKLPVIGPKMETPFLEYLGNQKAKLHGGLNVESQGSGYLIAWIFEKVVAFMILYFIISIINSMAQSYHKRIYKKHLKLAED